MTNELLRILILLAASAVSSLGLAIVYGVKRSHLIWTVLSAVLCCAGYEIAYLLGCGLFMSAFVGAVCAAAYSEFMAHLLKAPATIMIIVGILPLVPGAKLYYTMLGLVQDDMGKFSQNGEAALLLAVGIAVGIIAVTAVSRPVNAAIAERNIKKNKLSKG